jgi:hypothetical protein
LQSGNEESLCSLLRTISNPFNFRTDISSGAGMKTGKSSKIDRITHILEGRKDTKFEHDGHAGGLTNKEKLRKKNFIMVRKGKKSVNNKSRKAAGLDRHEKNTAVGLQIYFSLEILLSNSSRITWHQSIIILILIAMF